MYMPKANTGQIQLQHSDKFKTLQSRCGFLGPTQWQIFPQSLDAMGLRLRKPLINRGWSCGASYLLWPTFNCPKNKRIYEYMNYEFRIYELCVHYLHSLTANFEATVLTYELNRTNRSSEIWIEKETEFTQNKSI